VVPKTKRKQGIDINRASLSEYPRISKFLVDSFYTDKRKAENNLPFGQLRSLERDQNLDLKARYGRNTARGIESVILTAEAQAKDTVGCVALGITPFVGKEAKLSIRDLYNYPKDAVLRPIVANLAVRPDVRRKGIAKKLMKECEEVSKEWGYKEIWLLVEDDNRRAKKLYRKLGYKNVMSEPDTSFKVLDGRVQEIDVTNVYMRKSLKPGILGVLENTDWLKVGAALLLLITLYNEESRLLLIDLLAKYFDVQVDSLPDFTQIIHNYIEF